MTTFLIDDSGSATSRPVELYAITNTLGVTTRYTSYHRDFVFGGNTYVAIAAVKRGQFAILSSQGKPEMTLELPRTDPVVAAFCGVGIAPQRWQVAMTRVQQTSGGSEKIFAGYVSECTLGANAAVFRIVQVDGDGLDQPIPKVELSKACQHVLYDPLCGVSRVGNQVTATITIDVTDNKKLTVSTIGAFTSNDAIFGDLIHLASGEKRSIVGQIGTLLFIDVPLPTTAANGDTVSFYRGCDLFTDCKLKFNNQPNHGGHPHNIAGNPWLSGLLTKQGF